MKFTLFLPLYNVADKVTQVLDRIPADALAQFQEILLIDNGSTDGTLERLTVYLRARQDPRFRLFRNRQNYLLGGSTIMALRKAIQNGSDFLICLHSDGQADPTDLRTFLAKANPELDFVFGSRLSADADTSEYSFLRLWGNHFFAWLQRKVTRDAVEDIGAYIAFNLRTVERLPYWQVPHDMAYQPLLVLYTALRQQIRFVQFPIRWGKVEHSNVNILAYGLRHLRRMLGMMLGYAPLRPLEIDHFQTDEIRYV